MSIPKIIHYCWFGRNPKPELALRCIESWKKFCPDYEIVEWNEDNFDINCCDYVREAYEAKMWAFVSDYVRLYVVNQNGGIYFDTDVEVIKNLDTLLSNFAFMCFENSQYVNTGLGFGSEKENQLLAEMISDYINLSFIDQNQTYDKTPCPERNTKVLLKHGLRQNNTQQIICKNVIFPIEYFCPKDFPSGKIRITNNTYAIHHYQGSWISEEDKKRIAEFKKYQTFFGNKYGELIYQAVRHVRDEGILSLSKKVIDYFVKQKKDG